MITRDFMKLLFIVSLTLVFSIQSATAVACFCGRCFPQNIQSKIDLKINSTVYKTSSDGRFKSCNFEKGKSLRGICFSKRAPNVKSFSTFGISDSQDYSLIHQSLSSLRVSSHCGILHASPVFLKNLSIRC